MLVAPMAPLQAGSVAQLAGSAVEPALLNSVHDVRRWLASDVNSSCVCSLFRAWLCVCGCACVLMRASVRVCVSLRARVCVCVRVRVHFGVCVVVRIHMCVYRLFMCSLGSATSLRCALAISSLTGKVLLG